MSSVIGGLLHLGGLFVQRVVKRANYLPNLMELSYACVRRQASYFLFGSHCRRPASNAIYRLAKPRRMRRVWLEHEKAVFV